MTNTYEYEWNVWFQHEGELQPNARNWNIWARAEVPTQKTRRTKKNPKKVKRFSTECVFIYLAPIFINHFSTRYIFSHISTLSFSNFIIILFLNICISSSPLIELLNNSLILFKLFGLFFFLTYSFIFVFFHCDYVLIHLHSSTDHFIYMSSLYNSHFIHLLFLSLFPVFHLSLVPFHSFRLPFFLLSYVSK